MGPDGLACDGDPIAFRFESFVGIRELQWSFGRLYFAVS
jgi:hypothetical protein